MCVYARAIDIIKCTSAFFSTSASAHMCANDNLCTLRSVCAMHGFSGFVSFRLFVFVVVARLCRTLETINSFQIIIFILRFVSYNIAHVFVLFIA